MTDANGNWHLYNIPLTDVDGTWPDVYTVYHTTNDSWSGEMRSVRNMSSEVYVFPLKSAAATWWDYPSPEDPWASPLIDDLLGTGTINLEALWLLDDANRAYSYVSSFTGEDPEQVHLYWAFGNNWSVLCGSTSCFGPIVGAPNGYGAFIQHSVREMPDVAVHEIAHAYRYNLTDLWVTSCPGGHSMWWITNPQCAWEEGWADFLPTVVNNDPCYDDNSSFGPCDPALPNANLENPTWGDGKATGSSVEGRVAGVLLDMHDSDGRPPGTSNEGWDDANSYSFSRTWDIIDPDTDGNPESTITDFWIHWDDRYSPSQYSITGPLYQNTVTTQVFAPVVLNDPSATPDQAH